MEGSNNISEESTEVKGFITEPATCKEGSEPCTIIRDWYDLPCLKYVRERLFCEKEFLKDLLPRHLRESKDF